MILIAYIIIIIIMFCIISDHVLRRCSFYKKKSSPRIRRLAEYSTRITDYSFNLFIVSMFLRIDLKKIRYSLYIFLSLKIKEKYDR